LDRSQLQERALLNFKELPLQCVNAAGHGII